MKTRPEPRTILYVEDQLLAAVPAMRILIKSGYDVYYVMNGENAVNLVEAGIPLDLVVMDIDLGPGICGITASRKIQVAREIPILFFSSYSERYLKEKVGNSQSVNFLSKKNTLSQLVRMIDDMLYMGDRTGDLPHCELHATGSPGQG